MSTACPAGVPGSALNGASSVSCSVALARPKSATATGECRARPERDAASVIANAKTIARRRRDYTRCGRCARTSVTSHAGGAAKCGTDSITVMKPAIGKVSPGNDVVRMRPTWNMPADRKWAVKKTWVRRIALANRIRIWRTHLLHRCDWKQKPILLSLREGGGGGSRRRNTPHAGGRNQ